MLSNATGESAKVSQFSEYAATRKIVTETAKNAHAKPMLSLPVGNSRFAVRGFWPSISLSAIRLKVIAADRAPNIATVIHRTLSHEGRPSAASTAPRNANGSANSVCSNLIIRSVVRSFWKNAAMVFDHNLTRIRLPDAFGPPELLISGTRLRQAKCLAPYRIGHVFVSGKGLKIA